MSELTASTLGDYRVEGVIGQGGIGQVFRGSHVTLGMAVALKVIDSKYTSSPGFRSRFVQYAQTITSVAHPNVVKVYHCGEQDGVMYVVMELVTGGSLKAVPVEGAWTPAGWAAVGLIKQAADGLAAVHAKGLTHGDITLSNLLLTKPDVAQAQIKVADVGLVALVGESTRPAASAARAAGIPDGPAQDLFSLGALLFEVTTGRSLLSGQPPEFPAGVPEELKSAIMRCLTSDSAMRFASCADLSEALGSMLGQARAMATDLAVRDVSPAVSLKTVATMPAARRSMNPPKPPAPLPPGGPKVPCLHAFDEAGTPVDMQFVRASGMTIGRLANNVIALPSAAVSATHARIDWDSRRVTVTDLGSANGTLLQGQRLLPQVAQDWGPEQWLQIGPYWLWLQRPSADPTAINATEIMLDHESKVLTITPGKGVLCRLTLVNQRTQVDHVKLSVEGIPEEWVEIPKTPPQLNAFQKQDVTIPINVPRSPAGRAGDYHVTFRAKSIANPDAQPGTVDAHWTVQPFEAMSASIAPARAAGRRQARYTITLQHDGNKPAGYVLTGMDEERQLECLFSHDGSVDRNRLQVENMEPGTKTNVKVKVAAARRWFGNAHTYPFAIQAAPIAGQQMLTTEAQFQQRAVFPIWMIAITPLVLIALILALPPFFRPVVRTLAVEPRNPLPGEKVEVSWDAPRASRLQLLVDDIPIVPDPNLPQGKYLFSAGFEKDARVRVVARNLFGSGANEVPVKLKPPPPAAPALVELFEVSPQTVVPEQQVTIRWRASAATRVELQPIGTVNLEGSQVHLPTADTTYTLSAFNKDNVPTTRTVSVRVRQPTIVNAIGLELTASSPQMRQDAQGMLVGVGQSVIFKWRADNAARVRIDAITPVSLEGQSGQKTAELRGEGSYSFTLVATNDKGQEFRSPPVQVRASCKGFPARVITFRFGCNKNPEVRWK